MLVFIIVKLGMYINECFFFLVFRQNVGAHKDIKVYIHAIFSKFQFEKKVNFLLMDTFADMFRMFFNGLVSQYIYQALYTHLTK